MIFWKTDDDRARLSEKECFHGALHSLNRQACKSETKETILVKRAAPNWQKSPKVPKSSVKKHEDEKFLQKKQIGENITENFSHNICILVLHLGLRKSILMPPHLGLEKIQAFPWKTSESCYVFCNRMKRKQKHKSSGRGAWALRNCAQLAKVWRLSNKTSFLAARRGNLDFSNKNIPFQLFNAQLSIRSC